MGSILVGLSGPVAGRSFPLEKEATQVGRELDNDIVVETQWVSRRHFTIARRDGAFVLIDDDSHNGTTVNGIPVTERQLAPGDRIVAGGATFLFLDADAEGKPAASESADPTLAFDETPLSLRETVQLKADDAVLGNAARLLGSEAAALAEGDTARALAATLEIIQALARPGEDKLAGAILDRLFDVVPAERGAILLGDSVAALRAVAFRPERFAPSRSALHKLFEQKAAYMTNEAARELDTKSVVQSGVTSLACVPLISEGDLTGAIYLDRRDRTSVFPESRLELLVGLGIVAASALSKSEEVARLKDENRRLSEAVTLDTDMVGESAALVDAQNLLARAAPTDATILIEGESGTGKELAARAVHRNSARRDGPFVKVDCTGLNENLLASELFGHERGAFTGAVQQKKGKLELADGGTVFLDEIGELPLPLQASLLRVLQDREFERVGGTKPIKIDVRLVAATNRDLKAEVAEGRFREDLFFRINVVRLTLPPLRERRGDIALLARYYANEFAKRVKRNVAGIDAEALALLERYDWPGNVRELANTMERAVVLGTTETIVVDDLPEILAESKALSGNGVKSAAATTYHVAVAQRKKELILDAVARAGGSITEAAKLLDLHPNYLHRLIRNLELRDQIK